MIIIKYKITTKFCKFIQIFILLKIFMIYIIINIMTASKSDN